MRRARNAGFTLIELLVICAILVVITGVVLVNNSKFGGQILLENLAFDMALSVRQAQVYGISVQRFGASTYSAGYGVHFDAANPSSYLLFADAVQANGLYDTGELVTTNSLDRGFKIASICATQSGQPEVCGLTRLDVIFKRPEPDAYISSSGASCPLQLGSCDESARIIVQSPRGDNDSIVVNVNGQISVTK